MGDDEGDGESDDDERNDDWGSIGSENNDDTFDRRDALDKKRRASFGNDQWVDLSNKASMTRDDEVNDTLMARCMTMVNTAFGKLYKTHHQQAALLRYIHQNARRHICAGRTTFFMDDT
eukprot:4564145-Pleurochrysis_carterae.AAC.1